MRILTTDPITAFNGKLLKAYYYYFYQNMTSTFGILLLPLAFWCCDWHTTASIIMLTATTKKDATKKYATKKDVTKRDATNKDATKKMQ